jgi:hypothetical protein
MKKTVSRLTLALVLGCALSAVNVRAQAPDYYPFTLSGEIGTTGYGGTGIYRFSDHFGVSGGMDYFYYSRNGSIKDVDYHANIRLMSEPVALSLYPWADSSFHLNLGAIFNQNRVIGNNPGGSFTLNSTTYPGTLSLNIQQQPIDPYLSIAGNFFYFDHGHHVSLGGELGAMYTGQPRVGLISSNPAADADVATERNTLIHYARDLEVWPILKLSLNISF